MQDDERTHEAAVSAAEHRAEVEREKRARDLYERMRAAVTVKGVRRQDETWWLLLVDVIGEIERERTPLRVLTVAADGSQSVRTAPAAPQPLTEAEARAIEDDAQSIARAFAEMWSGRVRLDFEMQCKLAAVFMALMGGEINTWVATLLPLRRRVNRGDIPPEVRPDSGVEYVGNLRGYAARKAAAEHPRDHVEDEGTVTPEAIEAAIQQGQRDVDDALALTYGTWKPEMAVTTGEPWSPKPGGRVRTVEKLKDGRFVHGFPRRPNTVGEAVWIGDHVWVCHDDGTEAPYDADELRPEFPKVGTSYPTPERASEPDDICKPCTEALGSPSPCAITHDFGPGAYPARRPWDGPRRYRSDDRDLDGHDLDLMIQPPDGNGDWYVSVLPHDDRSARAVRITTSGSPPGQHGVCVAVARLYEAMLPNAKDGAS